MTPVERVMTPVERLAAALLYEGYLLYPYRRSSVKNRQRWSFGCLYPRDYCQEGDSWWMQSEVLICGKTPQVKVTVRFLQFTGDEVAERVIDNGGPIRCFGLEGELRLGFEKLRDGLHKLTVRIENRTPFAPNRPRAEAQASTFGSTHTIIKVEGGELVSLLEPPESLLSAVESCRNTGTWPVLVGAPGARDVMLSSPIILYDYPRVAEESPGDLFDGTEIDEILTLRILTLTDGEKAELRAGDARAAALLDRTERLTPEELQQLHGQLRRLAPLPGAIGPGSRVRLHPTRRADIFDVVLAGRLATVAAVEQDLEGGVHYAVTIDDDRGQDLGREGRPGHRFYFHPDEVEAL